MPVSERAAGLGALSVLRSVRGGELSGRGRGGRALGIHGAVLDGAGVRWRGGGDGGDDRRGGEDPRGGGKNQCADLRPG